MKHHLSEMKHPLLPEDSNRAVRETTMTNRVARVQFAKVLDVDTVVRSKTATLDLYVVLEKICQKNLVPVKIEFVFV